MVRSVKTNKFNGHIKYKQMNGLSKLIAGDDGWGKERWMDQIQACQGATHCREGHEESVQAG